MANRFDNQRGTAPIVDSIKNERSKVKFSEVDLTSKISFDAGIGWIIPFDLIETLPDSDYELSYDMVAITRNPLTRRLLSGMSVYIHSYAEDLKDMWEGFPRFVTKGRSGTFNGQIPVTTTQKTAGEHVMSSHPYSPSSFLGVPPAIVRSDVSISNNNILGLLSNQSESSVDLNSNITFNALPLVMYQQLCILNYMPSNLLQNNKHFFPDNELHLKLSDSASGQTVYSLDYDTTSAKAFDISSNNDVTISSTNTSVLLNSLRVRQFRGDEFTTAMPFPDLVRGTIQPLDIGTITLSDANLPVYVNLRKNGGGVNESYPFSVQAGYNTAGTPSTTFEDDASINLWYNSAANHSDTASALFALKNENGASVNVQPAGTGENTVNQLYAKQSAQNFSVTSNVTLSSLRALAVTQKFQEMMARTDGSYNQMIKAHFNQSPDLHVGKPMYIGGMKQDMVFSEVVQTSESTANSPQGATNSRGVTAGSGYIGKYHSKDYGYIMSVLSIVPDVYYHQGLEKKWSRISQSDFYFPINNNLSPEALLNKRLYVSGTQSTDDNLFGYQERDSDYKSRRNRVAGRLVLNASQSEEDNAYVMKRNFTTTPTLSYGFTGMFPSNIDMTVFTTTTDTPFIFNIASRCKAKIPMPYITVPSDLGID